MRKAQAGHMRQVRQGRASRRGTGQVGQGAIGRQATQRWWWEGPWLRATLAGVSRQLRTQASPVPSDAPQAHAAAAGEIRICKMHSTCQLYVLGAGIVCLPLVFEQLPQRLPLLA